MISSINININRLYYIMEISDPTLLAIITDACNSYTPPVMRRATKNDFSASKNFNRPEQIESVPGHREQVEYGAKKRIKP